MLHVITSLRHTIAGPSNDPSPGPSNDPPPGPSKPSSNRKFQVKWKKKLWPRVTLKDGKMHCTLCTEKGKNNTLTQGCKTFNTSSLIRHEDSVDHKGSLEASILRQDMQSAINKVNSDQDKTVIKALKPVHWLA